MADLKTIISITQQELKRSVPVENAVAESLHTLSTREADVLARRAGLRNKPSETLAHIGDQLKVTRERVRQIEAQARKKLAAIAGDEPLAGIISLATGLVRERGGAVSEEALHRSFLPEAQQTMTGKASLTLVLELAPDLRFNSGDRATRPFYSVSTAHDRAVTQLQPILVEALKATKEPRGGVELHGMLTEQPPEGISYLLSEALVESALEIGTAFVPTSGKWGLAAWPEINPRNIREKTLFMLREVKTPMHFKDITERIRAAKFDDKKVTTQAVHNELINGDEFVLIGRGIYALGEWGYLPGTVADVIAEVLKKAAGPVEREAVVEAVLKQRHVSRNTILINLQDKHHFTRVGKTAYRLN